MVLVQVAAAVARVTVLLQKSAGAGIGRVVAVP
jgi:hypothetical protein